MAPLTFQQWRDLPAKLGAWDALSAGVTPSLPTVSEYRARVAAIDQALAEPHTFVDTERSAIAGETIQVDAHTGRRVTVN